MDDWDPAFVKAISAERRVFSFDSTGIGRSEGRVPETIAGMAAVTAEVIGRLGFRQADVLGWSLGGGVAQQLALDSPHLIRRLIIAGSSPGGINDETTFSSFSIPRPKPRSRAARLRLQGLRHNPIRVPL
ncbi:alpha/beta fold hydrolase [Rhizobium sp. ZK1]|jgi:pimeloyl-ACP methyl ester carboxylesterase|uniref:alpha/beta fold hydrolase n=1 Tax=Rhizobium sp. ZK1 TaxID=3389872 RepID=UPI0039F6C5B9